MKKTNNKKAVFDLDNKQIEEYTSFDDIQLEKNKSQDIQRQNFLDIS